MLTTPLASGSEMEEVSDYSQYNDADEARTRQTTVVIAELEDMIHTLMRRKSFAIRPFDARSQGNSWVWHINVRS